jgi:hypothetical protein
MRVDDRTYRLTHQDSVFPALRGGNEVRHGRVGREQRRDA